MDSPTSSEPQSPRPFSYVPLVPSLVPAAPPPGVPTPQGAPPEQVDMRATMDYIGAVRAAYPDEPQTYAAFMRLLCRYADRE